MRPIHDRVRDHVERYAEKSGLTPAAIAEKAGWSEKRFYRLLHGDTQLRASDMEVLSTILKKPIQALYRDPARRAA